MINKQDSKAFLCPHCQIYGNRTTMKMKEGSGETLPAMTCPECGFSLEKEILGDPQAAKAFAQHYKQLLEGKIKDGNQAQKLLERADRKRVPAVA